LLHQQARFELLVVLTAMDKFVDRRRSQLRSGPVLVHSRQPRRFRHPALARIFHHPHVRPRLAASKKRWQEAGVSPDALSRTVSAEVVPSRNWASRDLHSLSPLCLCVKFFSLTCCEKLPIHVVILAEAAHAFWRVAHAHAQAATQHHRKQTMLEQTVARLRPLISPDRIWSVTNSEQAAALQKAVAAASRKRVSPNQSAAIRPAIALAAIHIRHTAR